MVGANSNIEKSIIRAWIIKQLFRLLPDGDDDIVIRMVLDMVLDNPSGEDGPDYIGLCEQLDAFVGKSASKDFCKQLRGLLKSAARSPNGIPTQLLRQDC